MPFMLETLLASLGAAICLALLVHMFLPAARKARVDAAARVTWRAVHAMFTRRRRGGVPKAVRRTQQKAANKPRMWREPPLAQHEWNAAQARRTEKGPAGPARRKPPTDDRDASDAGDAAVPAETADAQRQAEREALDVIERVRQKARNDPGVEREGNVYRPDAFKPRPPQDKLH